MKAKYKGLDIEAKKDIMSIWEEAGGYMRARQYLHDNFGVNLRTAERWLLKIRSELKAAGSTLDGKKHEAMYVTGTTTLVDADGIAKLQWVKENVKKNEEANSFITAIERLLDREDVSKEASKPVGCFYDRSMLVKYPIADAHLGLLTYKEQVGVDWDLNKAVEVFTEGIRLLMASSPSSEVGLLLDLGDMTHVADSTGKTRGHGHVLDVSGRLSEVYEAAICVITVMVDEALKKHNKVVFRKTIGNHDGDTSVALNVFLKRLYKNEPRVVIEDSESLFWWYKFGNSLHFSTHGHTVKQKDLPEIIASDCKGVWSDCKYIYADTGHVHHQEVLETRTTKCESHNSLIPGDSYNYGNGYRSSQLLKSIVYDERYGEIARNIVNMEMIYAKLRN